MAEVPLHQADAARDAAVKLLKGMAARQVQIDPPLAEASGSEESQSTPQVKASLPAQAAVAESPEQQNPRPEMTTADAVTPGVAIIRGRITGAAVMAQKIQAESQPEDEQFDGMAENVRTDVQHGADLFGTAVRMIRASRARPGTKAQKLKSVALFIFVTGIQRVTDIRQHHLDHFAKAMETKIPCSYWKSPQDMEMTWQELLNVAQRDKKAKTGLSPSTIERHLNTIRAVIMKADDEGNPCGFAPRVHNLIPKDERTDAEKRGVFTFEQLSHLFQHPRWQGFKSANRPHTPGDTLLKDHHYWINLILAYTGARRSEIAGLLAGDVGEENGIPFVHIRPNHLRGLKNPNSKRRVPLHPHLIELGFLDFASRTVPGNTPLSPAAIPAKIRAATLDNSMPTPEYDDKFGDALDHVIRTCIERRFPGNPGKLCLHSMRHYVNDTFINLRGEDRQTLRIPEIDRRDLLAHEARGSG